MKHKNILLLGFRATGKSTIGRVVAQKLGWDFVEMDFLIESRVGKTINELTNSGRSWKEFRKLETEILEEVLDLENTVISAGGGVGVNDVMNIDKGVSFGEVQAELIEKNKETVKILLYASEIEITKRIIDAENRKIGTRPILNPDDAINLQDLSDFELIEKIVRDSLMTYTNRKPLYEALVQSKQNRIDSSDISIEYTVALVLKLLK